MSARTFARRFRAETGTTPLQWLIDQRVAEAQRLLEETELPVEEVASRAGFGTAAALRQHFGRALRPLPRPTGAPSGRSPRAPSGHAPWRPRALKGCGP